MNLKMKNRSHKYNINRPRCRYGHKYSTYKKVSHYDDAYMYTFFYKQCIFGPSPENCLSFSKILPQKIV